MWDVSETHRWFSAPVSTDVSFLRLLNKVQSRVHALVVSQLHLTLNGGVPVVLHSIVGPESGGGGIIFSKCDYKQIKGIIIIIILMRISGNSKHSPSRQHLGDLGPAVSQHAVRFVDDEILFCGPGGLLHVRVEVVVPALATLFPQSPLQVFGHHSPLFITVFIHQLDHLHTDQMKRDQVSEELSRWKHVCVPVCTPRHSRTFKFRLAFKIRRNTTSSSDTKWILV